MPSSFIFLLSSLPLLTSALPYYLHPSVTASAALSWYEPVATGTTLPDPAATDVLDPGFVNKGVTSGGAVDEFTQLASVNPDEVEEDTTEPPFTEYQCYGGEVTAYPSIDEWLSWESLWAINEPTILDVNNDDAALVGYIQSGIVTVAGESNVDARLVLAAVMQESTGEAAAECTDSGEVINCGIMQSHDGYSFDPADPENSVLQMLRDGVQGTDTGPGWAQYLSSSISWAPDPYPGNPYAAARSYNSGSISPSNNLDDFAYGIPGYTNDIANRLLGWDGVTKGDWWAAGCGSGEAPASRRRA